MVEPEVVADTGQAVEVADTGQAVEDLVDGASGIRWPWRRWIWRSHIIKGLNPILQNCISITSENVLYLTKFNQNNI